MAKITENNKDVYQSYVLTSAKYDFSVYEKRIMYRLVEEAQMELDGISIRQNMCPIVRHSDSIDITMPVADILKDEKDNNYAAAKKAFETLSQRHIEYEDEKIWMLVPIITKPKIDKGTGLATFKVFNEIWRCALDFSKGYRKYELMTAMRFKSVYSMRFYELMSGQTQSIFFKLEDLKERLRLNEWTEDLKVAKIHHKEKYKRIVDFEKRVLDPAKEELDNYSPYSFEYEPITVRSRGRSGRKVVGYKFTPKYIQKNRDPELAKKELAAKVGNITGAYGMLKKEVSDYLLYNMNMAKEEINANKTLFLAAQKELPNFVNVLADLKQRAAKSGKGIGWIINGLKGTLKEKRKEKVEAATSK